MAGQVRRHPMHGWWVYLTPAMVQEADKVGHMRHENAIEQGRIPGNGGPDPGWELKVHVIGALGELGSKQPFDPIVWHKFKRGNLGKLPDLGDFIDVKTPVPNGKQSLIVKRGGVKPHWAYLLTSGIYHPHYRLIGWMWGEDVLKVPLTCPRANRPAHVIPEDDKRLRDVRELVEINRARAQGK